MKIYYAMQCWKLNFCSTQNALARCNFHSPRKMPRPFKKIYSDLQTVSVSRIQPKTIDLSTRLWGITTEFVGFIAQSLELRSIV